VFVLPAAEFRPWLLLRRTLQRLVRSSTFFKLWIKAGEMNLEILTPEKKLYSGEVYGVQMPGISGSFEVLEKHAPLVSALKAGRVKVLKDKQNHFSYYDIQGGFVEVLNNKVTVLVEGAVPVEE
jgi:F-type H+-transporting ATPase subunit epsilon